MPFGAFIEFLPGKEGLLHISEIKWERLEKMDGVLEVGEEVKIKAASRSTKKRGNIRLSRKVLLPKPERKAESSLNLGGEEPLNYNHSKNTGRLYILFAAKMRQLKISKQITNRESASLDKYLQEIGRVDLLTIDDEVELARKIKAGDTVALEKLTKANLRFVVSVAKQYQNQGLTLGDLINEGNLGLIKAAQRFDETRGFKFISYAVWWIRQSILQALAEQSRIVRLPLNRVGSLNKMAKAFSELEQKYEREPSPYEISEKVGVEEKEVVDTLKISGVMCQWMLLSSKVRNIAC